MSTGMSTERKPRVVSLGRPEFVGEEYTEEFRKDFDYDILDATNHEEALDKLPVMLQQHGPIDAFIIRMGRPPYRPFDKIFKLLTPQCKIIASAAAGYDDFPIEWCTEQEIWLSNSVDAVAEATADMAFFLTLAVIRDTYRGELSLREGNWRGPVVPSRDPWGMTLGIVGMGAIGRCLAKRAVAFNMKIKYYNRRRLSADDEAKCHATYCSSLHELLAQSDVVSINCPLTKETEKMISTQEFEIMKDGAFIVNTARGDIIDEAALINALESGKITRAGLDVFLNEPDLNEYFKTSDKVIVQPHVAGLTDLAFQRGEREAFENIKALFKKGMPVSPVNHPRENVAQ
ncbi:glycerate-and formate-dehydrogenase [Fusarium longipes]|uniref:Glycerate-and formate-dehydrogenase n=1 Tax=Fusarium longipes TaxID=694270 RepID=A0A395SF28_9HYPO|nr:glycerate-and formate-dehydrogenase [Fusarium longipes]